MKTQEYLDQGYYANTDQYIKDGIDVFEVKKQLVLREKTELEKSDDRVYSHYDIHEKPTAEQLQQSATKYIEKQFEQNGIQKVFEAIENKGVDVSQDILMSVFISALSSSNMECAANVFQQQPKILEDLSVSEKIIDKLLSNYYEESSMGKEFRSSTQEQKLECLDFCLEKSLYENHGRRAVMQMACKMGDQDLYAIGSKERPSLLFKDMEKNKLNLSKEGAAEIMKDLVSRGANPTSFIDKNENVFLGIHQKNMEQILDLTGGNLSKEHAQMFLNNTLSNWARSLENSHEKTSTFDFQKTALACEKNGAKYEQYNCGAVLSIFSEKNSNQAHDFLTSLVNKGVVVRPDFSEGPSWKKNIIDDCIAMQQKNTLNKEIKEMFQQRPFPKNPMRDNAPTPQKKTNQNEQEQERTHRRM